MKQLTLIILLLISSSFSSGFWGFYGHKLINRQAVFSLPPEMIGFYKKHIHYITAHAVDPDKRRYAIKEEAPRHYIDLDDHGDSAVYILPRYWKMAVEQLTKDTLEKYGIVPWHVQTMKYRLTEAFVKNDIKKILKYSAEIGHYIGDANVPLHTTKNYNGQLTGQVGIHGLWESRLPEIYSEGYDMWIGKASYIDNTQLAIWEAVKNANAALDSVLVFDRVVKEKLSEDKWYSFEQRGMGMTKVFSKEYSDKYNKLLNGMVERQLRRSIKMTADFWYTCWIDAGQPDLMNLKVLLPMHDSVFVNNPELEKVNREHEH